MYKRVLPALAVLVLTTGCSTVLNTGAGEPSRRR